MSVLQECGRCGMRDTEPAVRLSLVNREREARELGRRFDGPPYAHEWRCRDRAACLERVRRAA